MRKEEKKAQDQTHNLVSLLLAMLMLDHCATSAAHISDIVKNTVAEYSPPTFY